VRSPGGAGTGSPSRTGASLTNRQGGFGPPAATPSHLAFTDESNWNTGRFRAVAAVSLPAAQHGQLTRDVAQIALRERLTELKWNRVGSDDRATRVAKAVFEWLANAAATQRVRLDVLTWDVQDSRHDVVGRDDRENLARMYHHLLVHVCQRWQSRSWSIHPDEGSPVRWWELEFTVPTAYRKKSEAKKRLPLWLGAASGIRVRVEPRDSKNDLLIQVADLAAGAVCFSRTKFAPQVLNQSRGQMSFSFSGDGPKASKSDQARWGVLLAFTDACRKHKMGVSLDSTGGLKTRSPKRPINFWWWTPQGDYDKAPRRDG
jgi:hypothetical protein